jgi:hypothetical protein
MELKIPTNYLDAYFEGMRVGLSAYEGLSKKDALRQIEKIECEAMVNLRDFAIIMKEQAPPSADAPPAEQPKAEVIAEK